MERSAPPRLLAVLIVALAAASARPASAAFVKSGEIPAVALPAAPLSAGAGVPGSPALGPAPLSSGVGNAPHASEGLSSISAPPPAAAAVAPSAAGSDSSGPRAAAPGVLPASAVAGGEPAAAAASGDGLSQPASAGEQAERLAAAGPGKAGLDGAFDGSRGGRAWRDEGGMPENAGTVYRQVNPASRAPQVLGQLGDFGSIANELVMSDVFTMTVPGRHELDHIIPPYAPAEMRAAALEVLQFADRANRGDAGALRFVKALAQAAAPMQVARVISDGRGEGLAPNPLRGGEYWDLAAGPNGLSHMLGRRDPDTTYRFFDNSPYVVALLDAGKRLMAAAGADVSKLEVVHADVNALARPPSPIAVLRNKNVHTYVPGFEKKLDKMTDWIAPGGVLLIENDPGPQRLGIVEKLRPTIERLIGEGWTLRFGGFKRDGLETLALTRPRAGQPKTRDAASARVWQEYMDDVHDLESGPSRMHALMRAMGLR